MSCNDSGRISTVHCPCMNNDADNRAVPRCKGSIREAQSDDEEIYKDEYVRCCKHARQAQKSP